MGRPALSDSAVGFRIFFVEGIQKSGLQKVEFHVTAFFNLNFSHYILFDYSFFHKIPSILPLEIKENAIFLHFFRPSLRISCCSYF